MVIGPSLLTLAACSLGGHNTSKAAADAQTAIVYLNQARQPAATLAHAVAPGAPVKQTGSDGPPSDCSAPLTGLTYFSIYRDFDAPAGRTGASLLPAITTELTRQGFVTAKAEPGGL